MMKTYIVEVRHMFFEGVGKTYKEAKEDANRKALLYFWGQKS